VATTPDEQQYMIGYNAGRSMCLGTGSSEAGRRWLKDYALATKSAYVAGFEWALWDYEDANGMRSALDHERTTG
jgi:hypothetical protein